MILLTNGFIGLDPESQSKVISCLNVSSISHMIFSYNLFLPTDYKHILRFFIRLKCFNLELSQSCVWMCKMIRLKVLLCAPVGICV